FGGNTACVEVRGRDGTLLVLDAGTGIRLLGTSLGEHAPRRVHVLLSHLHMDHIQGLGFFPALFHPEVERPLWRPTDAAWELGPPAGSLSGAATLPRPSARASQPDPA